MSTTTAVVEVQKHQAEALEWLRDHPRALLAHDTGLGKTVTGIEYVREVINEAVRADNSRMPGLVVWVTEASLLAQTKAEFAKFAPRVRVHSGPAITSGRAWKQYQEEPPHVLLVSYHDRTEPEILLRKFGKPSLVICDEVQAIKGGGKAFSRVLALTKSSPRVLAMTATPMQKNVMELWHVLAVLHLSDLLPKAEFGRRYATWSEAYEIRQPHGRSQYVGPKPNGLVEQNVGELREFVWRQMHRVTSVDTAARMPEWAPDTGPRWIRLSPPQAAAYEASGGGGVGYIKKTQKSRILEGHSPLVDEFLRLIGAGGEYAAEPKVIVSCGTLDVVALLGGRLEAARIAYRSIEGKTTQKERAEAIRNFWEDPTVRVLVGSDVLETGLNLQCARLLISLDCSENPMRERQREGRVRRIGSPFDSVTHVTLMPDTPQARRKWDRLAEEERDTRRVLDPQPIGV